MGLNLARTKVYVNIVDTDIINTEVNYKNQWVLSGFRVWAYVVLEHKWQQWLTAFSSLHNWKRTKQNSHNTIHEL